MSLPLPPARDRGGGQPLAAPLPAALQRPAAPFRRPLARRGLARQPARGRVPGDVLVGAVLRLRPRAGAAQGRRRRPGHGRGGGLRGRPGARRRDGRAVVGPVRPGPVRRARRAPLRALPAERRADPPAPPPPAKTDPPRPAGPTPPPP